VNAIGVVPDDVVGTKAVVVDGRLELMRVVELGALVEVLVEVLVVVEAGCELELWVVVEL